MKILLIKVKEHETLYKNCILYFSPRISTYRDNRPRSMLKLFKKTDEGCFNQNQDQAVHKDSKKKI